ncbi:MAG: hypothetical protein B6241_06445 [Spirochaetaceae bacterium 4572_59]|nr:MAG: hypothetical protein B6241_06445 [Spirochaetaceae bacterium 4572_59]
MKLLCINQDEQEAGELFRYFTPSGYSVIHYTNPLKAMDNFKEIRPEIVVFNVSDYPRHWKLATQFLRQLFSKETSLFILLVDSSFPEEDLHKSYILGVNGIVRVQGSFSASLKDIESLILHYKPSPHVRKDHHLLPLGDQPMDFMFMNPANLQLVTTRVLEISETGAVVKPTEQMKIAGLEEGMTIKSCSLKTGETIMNQTVRILKINGIIELVFLDDSEKWKKQVQSTIKTYN